MVKSSKKSMRKNIRKRSSKVLIKNKTKKTRKTRNKISKNKYIKDNYFMVGGSNRLMRALAEAAAASAAAASDRAQLDDVHAQIALLKKNLGIDRAAEPEMEQSSLQTELDEAIINEFKDRIKNEPYEEPAKKFSQDQSSLRPNVGDYVIDPSAPLVFSFEKFKNDFSVIPHDIRRNPNVVMAAVLRDGRILNHVYNELKDNKAIVLAAVTNNGEALRYASPRLRGDKDVVLAAVTNNGEALSYTSPRLRDDKDVVLAAVRNNGEVLSYASPRLQDDNDVVLDAVKNNVTALRYVSSRLFYDKEWLTRNLTTPEMENVKLNFSIYRESESEAFAEMRRIHGLQRVTRSTHRNYME